MARVPTRGRKNAAVLRARALRREMSLPEGLLWQVLRSVQAVSSSGTNTLSTAAPSTSIALLPGWRLRWTATAIRWAVALKKISGGTRGSAAWASRSEGLILPRYSAT